jgi:hypothetical protein
MFSKKKYLEKLFLLPVKINALFSVTPCIINLIVYEYIQGCLTLLPEDRSIFYIL